MVEFTTLILPTELMTTAKTGAVFEDFSPEVSKDFTSDAATFKLGLLIDFRFTGNCF